MKRAICAVLLILTLAGCGEAGHPQDGYAEGTLGDTMHTYFFDYTVERAYLCSELEGYVPAEDKELLAVEIVVENTGEAQVPMWDVDFQAGWGTEDEADHRSPLAEGLLEEQLPAEYTLEADEERTGWLVYEVPAGYAEFSITYQEYFDDGTTGDRFTVYFPAERENDTV